MILHIIYIYIYIVQYQIFQFCRCFFNDFHAWRKMFSHLVKLMQQKKRFFESNFQKCNASSAKYVAWE